MLPSHPHLECAFIQESESAVFGKLRKEGRLQLTKGGRIRVAYTGGLLIVSDGKTLFQYDPGARTAQKLDLRAAALEMPLLNVLLDPRALDAVYRAEVQPSGSVRLEPRKPGLPKIELEGQGGLLKKLAWVDATGARQVLELVDPWVPVSIPDSAYKLRVPAGTRWLELR
jgi:outer membrane lipoprotein-sorting protein